jgi:hypothetical protein
MINAIAPRPITRSEAQMLDARRQAAALSEPALDAALDAAEEQGDEKRLALLRSVALERRQPDLAGLRDELDDYFTRLDRPHETSTWLDEGIFGLRIRIDIAAAGLESELDGLTYWVRDADDHFELLVDHRDAPRPTEFARRTRRRLGAGAEGLRGARQLIISGCRRQSASARRGRGQSARSRPLSGSAAQPRTARSRSAIGCGVTLMK